MKAPIFLIIVILLSINVLQPKTYMIDVADKKMGSKKYLIEVADKKMSTSKEVEPPTDDDNAVTKESKERFER